MQIVYTTSNFKGGIYRAVLAILLGLALFDLAGRCIEVCCYADRYRFPGHRYLLRLLSLPETARNISGVLLP